MKVTYSGDLLRIDGQKVPKIINYDVEYDKLWGVIAEEILQEI